MHILLTNDDGPPSESASPYIATFARVLSSPPFSHTVSVVLPSTQRSWIGKAHLLPPSTYAKPGQTPSGSSSVNEVLSDDLQPSYLDPVNLTASPEPSGDDYWVLVPGTPATCSQLGIFHHKALFPHAKSHKIDLVLSGPNFGRNTTAAFALSSGTLGGALEAAVCGVRAIAISFAFFTRKETQELVAEASAHSIRIVEELMRIWDVPPVQSGELPSENVVPDIYSINTPLVEGVSRNPVKWTWMLDNKWRSGSLYKAHVNRSGASDTESKSPLSFKWSPDFKDVWATVESSPPGNDGLVIREGSTSVTPLRANFEGLYGKGRFTGEVLKL